jgi:hypothetical protein
MRGLARSGIGDGRTALYGTQVHGQKRAQLQEEAVPELGVFEPRPGGCDEKSGDSQRATQEN